MQLNIGGVSFRNPVITASGTFGMGDLFEDFIDYSKLGGITLKTVTRSPRKGNPPPRILETPAGLLNSIGLENEGFEKIFTSLKKSDHLKKYDTRVIFSIAGDYPEDFTNMAEAFSEIEGISMFELNLSCPNIHECGATFDSNQDVISKVIKGVSRVSKKPFSVKLSPSQDITGNAKLAEDMGSHAVTISNTFIGMAINIKTGKFVFKNKTAGYSGPAVKPVALYNTYRISQAVKIPVIASGGISSAEDAIEFIIAGAKFVSIGTMNFVEPDITMEIVKGIEAYFAVKSCL